MENKSKISVVGTVGVPACYGGFESLVENLLPSQKIDTVYCSSKAYSSTRAEYKGSKLKYVPLNANGVQSIPYDVLSIVHSLFFTKNHLLVLGVSGAVAIPLFKLFSKRKVVTNIDGLEWKRAKWGRFAKAYLKWSEKVAVNYSDVIVADNEAIAQHVKLSYGVQSTVIAYGGEHAVTADISSEKKRYTLAVCRIEPENNVEMILRAFAKSSSQQIKFIGNWDKSDFGRQLKEEFSKFSNIEIIDPIYELDKLFEIRQYASQYIHGHSAGGTNPSLVEMMHFGVPILAYDCNYNRASTEEQANYFNSESQLIELLKNVRENKVGEKMKEIAERRYTWSIVKKQYLDLFND